MKNLSVLGLMILSLLVGCPDELAAVEQDLCMIDADCPRGEVCADGECVGRAPGSCVGNADCVDGLVCRGADGDRRCVEPVEGGECSDDNGCDRDERCTTLLPPGEADCLVSTECANAEPGAGCDDACYGHCVPRPGCIIDRDCAITEGCDDGLCRPLGDCDADLDCPVSASCIAGQCTQNGICTEDEDCASDQSCVGGECTRHGSCTTDADCPDDQRCRDGTCRRRDTCLTDNNCAFDERCDLSNDGGTCVVIGECASVDDCPDEPGIACLDGICTRAPCGRDSECDDGLFCNGSEQCNPQVGCSSGTPPSTTDLPACANEACDEVNDRLVLTPIHTRCADASPCTDDVCDVAVGCSNPVNTFQPAPGPVDDCVKTLCQAGAIAVVTDDTEVPSLQGPANDCLQAVCRSGQRTMVQNDSELPPQGPTNDCLRSVCQAGQSVDVANDNETPPQTSNTDCQREVCSGGSVTQVADNTQLPLSVGCKDGLCTNGVPGTLADDDNCNDTAVCTVGTCNTDASCTQTPDDDLCDCSGTQVGLCRPSDPRAPGSGGLAGCVCLQPATLSCGLDDNDSVKRVFERFELFATATDAVPGSTFTWDIAGSPVGADPSAQVLGNATDAITAFFQATSPSSTNVKDWQLRVTLQEPDLPPQTCTVSVEAQPIPDTLEVTLFMNDGVDVDVHVIGGPGSSQFDMPFHELHLSSDNEDRDCYWDNCAVCSVSIPGVPCVAVSPRQVDFDGDGASLADQQDPQLDIDNTRGCFTADNGERSCIPEKITVELPAAGRYIVWTYLWGPPNSDVGGLLTSPSSAPVSLDIQCRGQRVVRSRTLKSDTVDGNGIAAPQNSARRYGGSLGFVQIDVPASGACTISN